VNGDRSRRVAWRLFWAWEDDKEERWLREMARQGWHLRQAALVRFEFDRGEPADVVYRLDYNILAQRDRDEYLGLFRAAGWEHVGEVANWHYFRTQAVAGADPDIFSDVESRIAKYKRLLVLLLALLPIFLVSLRSLLDRRPAVSGGAMETILAGGAVAQALLVVLWSVALVRIALHIRKLRRRSGP
jgi:hypothetical protein